jgi:RES domain-containing protein
VIQQSWRITKTKYVEEAFSGEGAWRFGGRWNSRGKRLIYTAEHASLAVLEVLVHLESSLPLPAYSLVRAEYDDGMAERLEPEELPRNWRHGSSRAATQQIGDQWIEERRSAVLGVPSVILPIETIFLINPEHPGFEEISIRSPESFSFDDRLLA